MNSKIFLLLLSSSIIAIVVLLFLFKKEDKPKEQLLIVVNNEGKNRNQCDYMPGKSFSEFIPPQECTPENNCFKGSYLRSEVYTNMCQVDSNANGLTREPINTNDTCFRMLGGFPNPNIPYQCNMNSSGQGNCHWK